MRRLFYGLVGAAIGTAVAYAQAPATPETQALQQSLFTEINTNLQLRTALISTQEQLAKAQAEVKRLTDKYAKAPGASLSDAKDEPKADANGNKQEPKK